MTEALLTRDAKLVPNLGRPEETVDVIQTLRNGVTETYVHGHTMKGDLDKRTIDILAKYKPLIRASMALMYPKFQPHVPKTEAMSGPMREIYDSFNRLIEHEVAWNSDWRLLLKQMRDIVVTILQDKVLMWRAQTFFEETDVSKIKMTEDDKFFARGCGDWCYDKKP